MGPRQLADFGPTLLGRRASAFNAPQPSRSRCSPVAPRVLDQLVRFREPEAPSGVAPPPAAPHPPAQRPPLRWTRMAPQQL